MLQDFAHHTALVVQGNAVDRLHAHLAGTRFHHPVRLGGQDHHVDAYGPQLLHADAIAAVGGNHFGAVLVHPDAVVSDHAVEVADDQLDLLGHGTFCPPWRDDFQPASNQCFIFRPVGQVVDVHGVAWVDD